jgi:hypothetical protein
MNRRCVVMLASAAFLASGLQRDADAQGLIARLPKDGMWVRYEGTMKQTEFRPESAEGDVVMDWIQHLTIKSVGSETWEFRGKKVRCRWLEFKVLTGKASESGVDTGKEKVGERIYKVLVPEERVVDRLSDGEGIPFAFLDIVKGFRKIGGEVSPIPLFRDERTGRESGALQVFPLIAPLTHYDAMEPAGNSTEDVQVPGGAVKARKLKAKQVTESPTTRTTNEAEIWRSDSDRIPFGLVKWSAKSTVERKDSAQPRSNFKPATQVIVEMSVHETGDGAKSELAGK